MRKPIFLLILCLAVIGSAYAQAIAVTSPNGGEQTTWGTAYNITWTYSGYPDTTKVGLKLLQGSSVFDIANNVSIGSGGQGAYSWTVGSYQGGTVPAGAVTGYKIRISIAGGPSDDSNAAFSIDGTFRFDSTGNEHLTQNKIQTIYWSYSGYADNSLIDLGLYSVANNILTSHGIIVEEQSIGSGGHGTYSWTVGKTEQGSFCGTDYRLVGSPSATHKPGYLSDPFHINCWPLSINTHKTILNSLSSLQFVKWSAARADSVVFDLKELLSKLGNPDQTETLTLDILRGGTLFAAIGKFGQGNRLLERQQVKLSPENLKFLQRTSSGFQLRVMDARGKILLVQNILLTK
jgi:hypothetical protein